MERFNDKEKAILGSLYKLGWKYIAKDKSGEIWVFVEKPIKEINIFTSVWTTPDRDCTCEYLEFVSPLYENNKNMFQDISWQDDEPLCLADYKEF